MVLRPKVKNHRPTDDEKELYDQYFTQSDLQIDGVQRINPDIVWQPQPGSQWDFLSLGPEVFEVLYEGTRGGGKTDCLIMSFAAHVGKGYGNSWRGILFRQTYPQLGDVAAKIKRWFPQIFGTSFKFNEASMTVKWKTGEELLLRHMKTVDDYWNYHGHEYPWVGYEELCNWPDPAPYLKTLSLCRCAIPGIPCMVRATANPYGPGHNWVKSRWRLPTARNKIIRNSIGYNGITEPTRMALHSHVDENKILLKADPGYKQKVAAAASSEAEAKAWLDADWDVVAGGMFDDVWFKCREHALVPPFKIPVSWSINRSMDWGESRPFSIGWWAESDGSTLTFDNGSTMNTVRGDLFRIDEWYGCRPDMPNTGLRMLASEVAKGILHKEEMWGVKGLVQPGPADTNIFDDNNGKSIAEDFSRLGVKWLPADKGPGSRVQGWHRMKEMLKNTVPSASGYREEPGMFICSHCTEFVRTIPALPRDNKNMDDVDTDSEDHIADEVRYRVRKRIPTTSMGAAH